MSGSASHRNDADRTGGRRKPGNSHASAGGEGDTTATTTTIQLDSMSLDELHQLQQQEEARLQALSGRYAALRQALVRVQRGSMALTDLDSSKKSENNSAREVMVPLTESVYVSGKIREGSKLLVELGTGYYAEKSHKETTAFFARKEKLVNANMDNLQVAMRATTQNVEAIRVTMQGKMLEIRAKQEGARHREAVESSS